MERNRNREWQTGSIDLAGNEGTTLWDRTHFLLVGGAGAGAGLATVWAVSPFSRDEPQLGGSYFLVSGFTLATFYDEIDKFPRHHTAPVPAAGQLGCSKHASSCVHECTSRLLLALGSYPPVDLG